MRVPWCASSNKDRTKWTWYQCPASTDVPALVYIFYAVGLYVNDSCDFLLTCSLYSYCCWFICQWLLWFIWTWQGAKPRTPINKQSNKFVSCLICMLQDSVPAGSYNDPFLSSVIPMVTPTWCHRANWGNPSWGQCRLTWIPNSHILI